MLKEKVKYNCHQSGTKSVKNRVVILCLITFFCCGCTNAERNDLTEYEPEQENGVETQIEEPYIYAEENTDFFMEQLDIGIGGARDAAEMLEKYAGCKKLVRIENLRYEEKYGSKYYCMTVVDEDEAEFFLTVDDYSVGYIQDMEGNDLFYYMDD